MKSTLLIAALMSSLAVAYQSEDLVDALGSPFGVFDGDDDWEAVEPVQVRTTTSSRPVRPAFTTSSRPVRPAFTTSSRYSCTTTTPLVPAVATTSSVKPLEWNAVKQVYSTSPSVSIRAITSARPSAATTSVSVNVAEAGHWKPWSTTTSEEEVLTITYSTYQIQTVTDTVVAETTTPAVYTTPVYQSRTTPLYVASTTTTLQYVLVTTPAIPAQTSATTTTSAIVQETSLVASFTGSAVGIQSQLLAVLTAAVLALLY